MLLMRGIGRKGVFGGCAVVMVSDFFFLFVLCFDLYVLLFVCYKRQCEPA